jgi:hypothetical protein
MKIIIRRGRKIGDPNYSSTDVGLELALDCDDETYYDKPEDFRAWFAAQCQTVDRLLEAEITRIYACRPGIVGAGLKPATTSHDNSHRDGHDDRDRAIDEARSRREPEAARNGYTKERHEWDRRGDRPPDRDDRRGDRPAERGRDGRRSNSGHDGPPRNGKALYAWAKDQEEAGARGFVKKLQNWCKSQFGAWRFDELNADEVREAFAAGERMIEDAGGY